MAVVLMRTRSICLAVLSATALLSSGCAGLHHRHKNEPSLHGATAISPGVAAATVGQGAYEAAAPESIASAPAVDTNALTEPAPRRTRFLSFRQWLPGRRNNTAATPTMLSAPMITADTSEPASVLQAPADTNGPGPIGISSRVKRPQWRDRLPWRKDRAVAPAPPTAMVPEVEDVPELPTVSAPPASSVSTAEPASTPTPSKVEDMPLLAVGVAVRAHRDTPTTDPGVRPVSASGEQRVTPSASSNPPTASSERPLVRSSRYARPFAGRSLPPRDYDPDLDPRLAGRPRYERIGPEPGTLTAEVPAASFPDTYVATPKAKPARVTDEEPEQPEVPEADDSTAKSDTPRPRAGLLAASDRNRRP